MDRENPRPQFYREDVMMLDGIWQANGQDVLVPYPLQSELSGFKGEVPEEITYVKEFEIEEIENKDYILHFGAVDQVATVYLNDIRLGEHEGGYLDFCFDISDVIKKGTNSIVVEVVDRLDVKYPYGKQSKNPSGMWYTAVSGIWKSVYIEIVPNDYITSVAITPTKQDVKLNVSIKSNASHKVDVRIYDGVVLGLDEVDLYKYATKDRLIYQESISNVGKLTDSQKEFLKDSKNVKHYTFEDVSFIIDVNRIKDFLKKDYEIKKWDVDRPNLYPVEIKYGKDKIFTYIAFREISIENLKGVQRICLNDKAIFMHGVLDQGYFEEGIFTPKDYKEYDRDILRMKKLGFNTLRKHIKIEPEQFYYACDRIGMYVIQDMVNSGKYNFCRDTALPTIGAKYVVDWMRPFSDRERKDFFVEHSIETLDKLYNHPSIICYTIFNEGWGQFESDKLYELLYKEDSTRLYDSTSGWFHQLESDFDSRHVYFRNARLHVNKRPLLLSECGGYMLDVSKIGLLDSDEERSKKKYGYGTCYSETGLSKIINTMYKEMVFPYISKGLCGCIYTQLSDVEGEINGLYTYDRKRRKVVRETMLKISDRIKFEMDLVNILSEDD